MVDVTSLILVKEALLVSRSAVRNHVFHASLSLSPDERPVMSSEGKIAKRFMEIQRV